MLSSNSISVAVIGTGSVGAAMVHAIRNRQTALEQRYNCSLELRAWCNSKQMVLADHSETVAGWGGESGQVTDLPLLAEHVRQRHGPYSVIVDCSGSVDVAEQHPAWLSAGIHVVTANKKGLGGCTSLYERIMSHKAISNYNYETTVGASLPMIFKLRQMMNGGDTIHLLRGSLSACMNWVMHRCCPSPLHEGLGSGEGCTLTAAMLDAEARGLTERDLVDDIGGIKPLSALSSKLLLLLLSNICLHPGAMYTSSQHDDSKHLCDRWVRYGVETYGLGSRDGTPVRPDGCGHHSRDEVSSTSCSSCLCFCCCPRCCCCCCC